MNKTIENLKKLKSFHNGSYGADIDKAIKAIEQQDVLDKIRAEMAELIEWHDCPIELDNGNDAWYCEAVNRCIEIIDKYKAESEG